MRRQWAPHLLWIISLVLVLLASAHLYDIYQPSPPPASFQNEDPPPSESPSLINYQEIWRSTSPPHRPLVFAALVSWLVFLFIFVGIAASDFFCPNLSTIASSLGLSESVAGVTFLAFSNGSPDVFSTFSAFNSNSGSLAIGELIGAASFIVSVVVGTMCLIKPFQVTKHTFLRDVGFFAMSTSCVLFILWDGKIYLWEALTMVALYLVYVTLVVVTSWWRSRRELQQQRIRDARLEWEPADLLLSPANLTPRMSPLQSRSNSYVHLDPDEFSDSEVADLINRGNKVTLQPTASTFLAPGSNAKQFHNRFNSISLTSPYSPLPLTKPKSSSSAIRPSLLSAIEFRDVVNSLQADSGARTLAIFGDRDAHYHAWLRSHTTLEHGRHRSQSLVMMSDGTVPDHPTIVYPSIENRTLSSENPWSTVPSLSTKIHKRSYSSLGLLQVPAIRLVTEAGEETELTHRKWYIRFHESQFWRMVRAIARSLFPSLNGWSEKSFIGKTTAILCIPAILLLNLTLPVVEINEENMNDEDDSECLKTPTRGIVGPDGDVTTREEARRTREHVVESLYQTSPPHPSDCGSIYINHGHNIWDSGPESSDETTSGREGRGRKRPPLSVITGPFERENQRPEEQNQDEEPSDLVKRSLEASFEDVINEELVARWLMAIQCLLAPIFCVLSLSEGTPTNKTIFATMSGGTVLALTAFFSFTNKNSRGRVSLCFIGFFVAMVWIMLIANEVVGVLMTFGKIFQLSEAILGLTVFAMGNSFGDLISNTTVARMGFPSMAIAACFGSPMLNILLGVGLSGTYLILKTQKPLHVQISKTLVVSGVGLLAILAATLIFVPLNGYRMSKSFGYTLIFSYFIMLSINIVVETMSEI